MRVGFSRRLSVASFFAVRFSQISCALGFSASSRRLGFAPLGDCELICFNSATEAFSTCLRNGFLVSTIE